MLTNTNHENTPLNIIKTGFAITAATFVAVSLFNYVIVLLFGKSISYQAIFTMSRFMFWGCLAVVYWHVRSKEKQPFLLWPERKYGFEFYIASVLLIMVTLAIGVGVLAQVLMRLNLFSRSPVLNKIIGFSWPLKIFTCITAGVVEELVFRGYLMPRVQLFFKSMHWPAIISAVIFGLLHIRYGTVINVAGPMLIGFVFAYHYQKFRNIRVLIACHFLWDMMAFLMHK